MHLRDRVDDDAGRRAVRIDTVAALVDHTDPDRPRLQLLV
jgi:hypothetical protein